MPRIVAVIPACDEEQSVGKVVKEIPQPPVEKIIVVNNNSHDRTAEVAAAAGARVVFEGEPGYGAACLRGIAEAKTLGAEIVVFLDADRSDYPEEIPALIAPILAGECDFVIGSRALGVKEKGAMTPQQIFGNWLACFLMRFLLGARYSDLGPFRSISMAALEKLQMRDRNYGWTVEMQIKAALRRLRVREVPARYRKRIGKSKISGTVKGTLLAGWKIVTTILRHAFFPQFFLAASFSPFIR
ncbi:MAG: glycosyltransferase family 2 protein [candidate division KSB1 bacterium]|nr:glycosyltransferase family 2 protein [candidate division KSB1 bacterium]MDZ7365244.1 glycosyltransferase family 2 protein [candidate division KSB1 bacterium]MDZ7403111.1 glycosyltransferase family 2 protein [candidate division KSB1 bacterium]